MLDFVVGESEAGGRLDLALSALAGLSRAEARRWIDAARVRLNDGACRGSQRVAEGDRIAADPPEPVSSELVPEHIPLAVLLEDEDLIAIDKPAGLVVHPAPGHPQGTLVNALLHHCRDLSGIGGVLRPGIVHRLDRGTSGVMVAAKHDRAHRALAEQFRLHTIERVYWAFVRGVPNADRGQVDRAVGRHPRDRKRMSTRTHSGREARTDWSVVERFPRADVTWLEVRPQTGRTHQIRVHLSSTGLPLLGDPVYGRKRAVASLDRPALHAAVLGFEHPRDGAQVRLEAPLPPDLRDFIESARRREPANG